MTNKRQIMRIGRHTTALLLAVLAVCGLAFGLSGCGGGKKGATFFVDYGEDRVAYRGARDAYQAGENVTLYYNIIASDTDYAFYLDDEKLTPEYDEEQGYKLQFVMPDHDVKLRCVSKDSMTEDETTEPQTLTDEGTALVRYDVLTGTEDKGDRYTLTLSRYPDETLILDVYAIAFPDGKEAYVRYVVPSDALTECMDVIDKGGVRQWKTLPAGPALDGKAITCTFLDGDKNVTISSDHMPLEGGQALQAIRETLEKYLPKVSENTTAEPTKKSK